MGTRCLTFVYDNKLPILNLYRQFDGYPSGHGQELGEFLKNLEITNGIAKETKGKSYSSRDKRAKRQYPAAGAG